MNVHTVLKINKQFMCQKKTIVTHHYADQNFKFNLIESFVN